MNTTINSVLVECRGYRDTYGQDNTSARLWINGRGVAVFPLQYGSPSVLEEYTVRAYLIECGILADGANWRYLGNRVRDLGADYYVTEAWGKRSQCFKHGHALTPEELRAELAYFDGATV